MGDVWLNEYDGVFRSLNQLTTEIKEYSIQQRNNPSLVNKNTPPTLRRALITLNNNIASLQDSLTYGNNRTILEKELLRRKNLVEGLISRKNQITAMFDSAVNNESAKSELLGDSSTQGKRVWGKPKETETTKDLSNHQIFYQQQDIMKQQDESLDVLSQSIMRQKNMASAMSTELEIHNRLLDEVEIGVEVVDHKLRNTNSRMEKIKQNAGSTCMIVIIVILIILIVVLVATDSGCKIYNDPDHCP